MADNQSIVESRLFQSVSPHITSITKEQLFLLFRGLKKQGIHIDWRATDLNMGFSWGDDSGHDTDFWRALHNEYEEHDFISSPLMLAARPRNHYDEVEEIDIVQPYKKARTSAPAKNK